MPPRRGHCRRPPAPARGPSTDVYALFLSTSAAYIDDCRRKPAMAINGRRNKPIGPGGSTRRLHQFGGQTTEDGRQPGTASVLCHRFSAYGGEIGSTRA